MDYVYLPFVDYNTPLEQALELLSQSEGRGIIRFDQTSKPPRLIWNDLVVNAYIEHVSRCGEIAGGETVGIMPPDILFQEQTLQIRGSFLYEVIEGLMDAAQLSYVVPSTGTLSVGKMGVVITKHEGLRGDLTSRSKVGVCKNPRIRHSAPCPPPATGNSCRICGYPFICS